MPDDIPVNLLILNSDGTVTFVDNDYSDICTGSNNDISITYDDSQTYADVTVNVKWACESPLADQTVGVPSTPLALYSTSGGTWYGTTNSSGTYTFSDIPVNAVVSVVAEDRRPTERISSGDTDSQKLELFSVTSGGVSKTITFTVNATDTECVGAESGSTGGTGGSGS